MSHLDVITDLSNKKLRNIPENVLRRTSTKMLYLERNDIEYLPKDIFVLMPKLTWLDLRNNRLKEIPLSISNHVFLETLLLQDNMLEVLPDELGLVPKLKVLQLAGNPLRYPSEEILKRGVRGICEFLKNHYHNRSEPSEEIILSEVHERIFEEPPPQVKRTKTASSDNQITRKKSVELKKEERKKMKIQELLKASSRTAVKMGGVWPVISIKGLTRPENDDGLKRTVANVFFVSKKSDNKLSTVINKRSRSSIIEENKEQEMYNFKDLRNVQIAQKSEQKFLERPKSAQIRSRNEKKIESNNKSKSKHKISHNNKIQSKLKAFYGKDHEFKESEATSLQSNFHNLLSSKSEKVDFLEQRLVYDDIISKCRPRSEQHQSKYESIEKNLQSLPKRTKLKSGSSKINSRNIFDFEDSSAMEQEIKRKQNEKYRAESSVASTGSSKCEVNKQIYHCIDKPITKNEVDKNEFKSLWLENLKDVLTQQESILQQEKNLKELNSWRLKRKIEPLRKILHKKIENPYDTDPEYEKMPNRKDINEIPKKKTTKKSKPKTENLDDILKEVSHQLKEIESSIQDSDPQSTQAAALQIQEIAKLQKKILQVRKSHQIG